MAKAINNYNLSQKIPKANSTGTTSLSSFCFILIYLFANDNFIRKDALAPVQGSRRQDSPWNPVHGDPFASSAPLLFFSPTFTTSPITLPTVQEDFYPSAPILA